MSGRKTTYTHISVDELRNLRERAAKASSLQESNRILNQLNAKNDAALSDYRNRISSMNNSINNLNNMLNKQTKAASKETQALREQLRKSVIDSNNRIKTINQHNENRINELNRNFTQTLSRTKSEFQDSISRTKSEFQDSINRTRADFSAAMDSNNRRIEAAMQINNQNLQRQIHEMEESIQDDIQDIRSQLNSIEESVRTSIQNQDILLDMSREYMQMIQVLLDDIRTNYRTELLCPGRIEELETIISSAKREIKDAEKMPENSATARREARLALESTIRLRNDIIKAEQEWLMHYQAARQVMDATNAQLDASRILSLPDEENASVDVDNWTDGDLSLLGRRLSTLENQIDIVDSLTIKDLDDLRSAGIQLSREIDDTTMFAAEAFYASQDRGEIAQDIADQLQAQGLTLIDHSYQGNDMRAAHRLHLRNNVTGFELVITQTPVISNDGGTLANHLESDILNYGTLNEEHGDRIARSVLSSLSQLGLEQTEVRTVHGFENSVSDRVECADMQQWRTENNVDVVRPVHTNRRSSN